MKNLSFNVLRRILIRESRPFSYGIVCLGGYILSFIILFVAYQFYRDLNTYIRISDDSESQYMILNKTINWMDTLKIRSQGFSVAQVDDIRSQGFIKKVEPFTSNQFHASLYIGGSYFPRYAVDLFFESIDSSMIDLQDSSEIWKWKEGDSYVPILIPHTFFALYNFGFAPSRGLPTLSEEMAGKLDLHIQISNRGSKEERIGRIVGLSKRINSVLVPSEFMKWANDKYGNSTNSTQPTRLMIQYDSARKDELQTYLESNHFQSNTEIKPASTYLKWVTIGLLGVQALGLFIGFLSLLLNLLIVRIIISSAQRNIVSLRLLGCKKSIVFKFYWSLQFTIQILALFLFIPITYLLRSKWIESYNLFSLGNNFRYEITSYGPVVLLIMISQLILYYSIKKQISSEEHPEI